jgi:CDP-diacylglycerol--glycerol-3-phosphate 3-phosphatidyltransferase
VSGEGDDREAPRLRDLPAPRRNESAAGSTMQRLFAWPYRALLAFLLWTGVRAWQLTVLSLVLNGVAGWLIVRGSWFAAGVVLVLAGSADVLDGSVARQRGESGRSGAFLDAVLDRIADAIVFGCLTWELAQTGRDLDAGLALVTLVVSLGVSHVRAEAEAAGVPLTEGFFQRLERFLATIAALVIPGAMRPALVALAGLGTATLLQRSWTAVRRPV